MQYLNLGNTGLKVSRICLGMMSYGDPKWRNWVLNEDESKPFVSRALDKGINFFDTANMYSLGVSEEITGRALKEIPRDEIVVATKVYQKMGKRPNQRGLSRKHIMEQIDLSLGRLGMDYVDLYQTHRWDYETPIEETMEALNDVVRAGKALYIGASSMYAWQFSKAQAVAEQNGWSKFVSMQNHYNLVYREEEREMIPNCIDSGVGIISWSPLARGFLAGNRDAKKSGETLRARSDDIAHQFYFAETDFQVLERVTKLAGKLGHAPAQIALAWILRRPGIVSPIIGATKMNHLDDAVGALEIKLTDDDMHFLEELYQPHRVLGHT